MSQGAEVNIDQALEDAEEAKKIIANSLKHINLLAGEFRDRKPYHGLIIDQLKKDWKFMVECHRKYPDSRFFDANEVCIAAFNALPRGVYEQIYVAPRVNLEQLRLVEFARKHGITYSLY